MTDKRRQFLILALISTVILIGTYKLMIASQIRAIFQKQGLENIELYVESAGLSQSKLRDVAIGDTLPLEIGSATFEYSLPGLISQRMQKISLDNVKIRSRIVDGAFMLFGLEGLVRDFMPPNSDVMIPGYFFLPDAFAFDELHITNGSYNFNHNGNDITISFNLDVERHTELKAKLTITHIKGKLAGFTIEGDKGSAELTLEDSQRWRGGWNATLIPLNNNEKKLPLLELNGKIMAETGKFRSRFLVKSTPQLVKLNAEIQLQNANSYLTLSELQVPFADGTLAIERLAIPFDIQNTIHFNVECRNVASSKLLSLIFKGDVKAGGTLNGTLPLALTRAGTLIFYQASLNSEDMATVSIPAALIPQQPRNSEAIRRELQSMDYERLAIELESGEKDMIDFNIVFIGQPGVAKKGRAEAVNVQTKNNLGSILSQFSDVFVPSAVPTAASAAPAPVKAAPESPVP